MTLKPRERFLAAARAQSVDRPPVWLMRQAGRYLPEYRELRGDTPFMELCRDVDRSVEISLQPLRRFGMDAVIFFCDILVPLQAMGLEVVIDEGGPKVIDPVRVDADLERVQDFDPGVETAFVGEILTRLHREIDGKAALLGFAGAPWTTGSYAIEGGGSRDRRVSKTLMKENPGLVHAFMGRIADNTATYLKAQIEAGVDGVQLFDTWAGDLTPTDYETFAAPYHAQIFEQLPRDVTRILYVNGSAPHIESMARVGADVLSVDWRLDLADVRRRAPGKVVQGNVDPCALFGPEDTVREAVRACIASAGPTGHIMNLGHGIMKQTRPENVGAFVDEVKKQ